MGESPYSFDSISPTSLVSPIYACYTGYIGICFHLASITAIRDTSELDLVAFQVSAHTPDYWGRGLLSKVFYGDALP